MARKVLLADDSVTAQNMGRRILSDAGYEVITVNNGSAALKKIAELKPDLVILDVYMPGYSGIEVCQRLREAPETSGLPVLLTVGKLEPFRADQTRKVKADGHIVKPFEATELIAALAKLEEKIVARPAIPVPAPSGKPASSSARAAAGVPKTESKEAESKTRAPARSSAATPEAGPEQEASSGVGFREISRPPSAESRTLEASSEFAIIPEATVVENAPAGILDQPGALPPIEETSASSHSVAAEPPALMEETEKPQLASEEQVAEPDPEHVAPWPGSERPAPQSDEAIPPLVETETDAEVLAAIAALVKESGFGERQSAKAEPAVAPAEPPSEARWMLASVPLAGEEAGLSLELEMERAQAPLAAPVEAAACADPRLESESLPEVAQPVDAVDLRPLLEAAVAMVEGQEAAGERSEMVPTSEFHLPAAESAAEDLEAAGTSAAEDIAPDPASSPLVSTIDKVSGAYERGPDATETQAAYAAAAGAVGSAMLFEGAVASPAQEAMSAASLEPVDHDHTQARQSAAELASVWQNWKQVRETSITAGSGALPENEPIAAPASQPHPAPAPAEIQGPSDKGMIASSTLESIVDSVLAELRPKLLEEIARKMAIAQKS